MSVVVRRKKLLLRPKDGSVLTRCVFREFGLTRLKAFSTVLVKNDRVIIREDDWDICIARVWDP